MDILDTSYKTLSDYLIDNQINIYNDDDYKIKFKKILLKYKRIIGIIVLILFLIIGYYEYNIDTYEYINIKFQTGGEIGKIKGFSGATHFISKRYQDLKGIYAINKGLPAYNTSHIKKEESNKIISDARIFNERQIKEKRDREEEYYKRKE